MTPQQILTAALRDLEIHGYDSPERIERWVRELTIAIERTGVINDIDLKQRIKASLMPKMENAASNAFKGMGIKRFTKANIPPRLYNELDRRIIASASLIKLNRTTAVNDTLQRFIGWSTSIPAGGGIVEGKAEVKQDIKKSLSQLDFVERRVIIDQTHKLIANVNNIVAVDNGAIAVEWNSHWRQKNYNYREDHKELDGKTFLIKDSWADKAGLVKGDYYEDLADGFGQAVFCRCYGKYIFNIKRLPSELLTNKGVAYVANKSAA